MNAEPRVLAALGEVGAEASGHVVGALRGGLAWHASRLVDGDDVPVIVKDARRVPGRKGLAPLGEEPALGDLLRQRQTRERRDAGRIIAGEPVATSQSWCAARVVAMWRRCRASSSSG